MTRFQMSTRRKVEIIASKLQENAEVVKVILRKPCGERFTVFVGLKQFNLMSIMLKRG